MKQFYTILGQTKDENKYPIYAAGWFKNKKEAIVYFNRDQLFECEPLYGFKLNIWEFITHYILYSRNINDISAILIKDLK